MEVFKLKKSKLLALVLALSVMVFSFATAVSAEGAAVTLKQGETTAEYETVAEAVADVAADGEQATITFGGNFTGAGVKVVEGQNIVFDLGGYTWDITDTVGSTGTETNGLQLLKGATVTIKNGAMTSKTAKLLIQNYCTLTLDNVKLSGQDNLTQLIVSSNNGSTTIKNGTEITAAAGGKAFDSDKWGSYDGGHVILEDGKITGDVNATNGGKMELNGGTIDGDVIASNYVYQGFENTAAQIVINGSTVEGDVKAESKGEITVAGGIVKGGVDSAGETDVKVTGGEFYGTLGEKADTADAEYMAQIKSGEQTKTVVGKTVFDSAVKNLKSGETISLLTVPADTSITVADGVKVENKTEEDVNVNDNVLEAGESIEIKDETSSGSSNESENESGSSSNTSSEENPSDNTGNVSDDTTEPDADPQMGDNGSIMLWFAVAAGTLCLAGGMLAIKKKERE